MSAKEKTARTGGNGSSNRGKDERRRCWACVVYPESCPENWLETVAEWGIPAAVSPLHDKDQNPDGTSKKPHYHLMVRFEGKKSADQVSALFDQVAGVGCIRIESPDGYTRYLVHKDNPEKYQYDQRQIRAFGGFDVMRALNNNADKTQTIREIQQFCVDNTIFNFADLMEWCAANNEVWYSALCTYCSALMVRYLKAREDREIGAVRRKMEFESQKYEVRKAEQKADIERWEADRKRMAQWYEERREFSAWMKKYKGVEIEGV